MLLYALSPQESSAIAERTRRTEPGASVVVVRGRQDILSLVSIIGALIRSGQPRFLVCVEPLVEGDTLALICQDKRLSPVPKILLICNYPDSHCVEPLVEGDTLALICQDKRLSPVPKILLICNYPDSQFSREIVEAHCDGILGISPVDAGTILQTLRVILTGDQHRDSTVTRGSRNAYGFSAPQRDYKLTAREQEVLQLIVQGYSNREMSEKLHLGLSTVKTHMGQLLEKLGVRDRTQAAVQAIALRLVPWPSVSHGGEALESDGTMNLVGAFGIHKEE